jgi:hypothetical protein
VALEAAAVPEVIAKPGNGKRPPIKITLVRPGGQSPLKK